MNMLSIIIPVYNEEKTISKVLDNVCKVQLEAQFQKDIIVVNDGSTDNSEKNILAFIEANPLVEIKYLRNSANMGKGFAVRQAINVIKGQLVIVQDGDLEYNPEEYNLLLQPVLDGFADVVYGSRFMSGYPHRVLFFGTRLGNQIVTFLSNMLTNLNLSDVQTCFKLFKTDIVKNISLKEDGFGFETEVTAKIASVPKIRIYEVGISYYGRTYEDGKKFKLKDAFKVFYCLIKYNMLSK